ncbi:MAG: methylenetetrahydrofolate reductase [NAD(P)H] [Clostridia bacterium]|nr:methylenetetrahydrofolate reductase [NAD(P)H] [Clostridia bacterium]
MKIIDIIKGDRPSLSFEVFPPKTEVNFESVKKATEEIAKLDPSYMSVTYGAGGGTSAYTIAIAENLKQKGITPLAHLSCVSSTKGRVEQELSAIQSAGIENILALRGDIPQGVERSTFDYHYATELIRDIKAHGDFCIGGACYPEGHPDSPNWMKDLEYLREKVDAGCDFLVTQMFFDNDIFYNFMYRAQRAGISVPVVPGIMPVTNVKSLKRTVALSGNILPQRFYRIMDRFADNPEALKQAGIAFATEQIIDLLANGVNAVHVYSMNKPEVASAIKRNLSEIL